MPAKTSALEIYKKRAKQLVRWHREGNYSVGERIRILARYRFITDVEALALPFPLIEAQEVVATESGYADWPALKSAVADLPITARPVADSPTLKSAAPILFVSNVSATANFFRDKLGFVVEFLHGHPAFYGAVSRGGAALHLRFVHEPVFKDGSREAEQLLTAFIAVENIKGLYGEYSANGVEFASKLQKEAWGGVTFTVKDLDGNVISFCQ